MTVEEMIKAHRDEAVKRIEKERSEKIYELDRWDVGLKMFCKRLEEDKHITKIRYSYYNKPSIEYYDTDAPTFDRIWISVFNDRLYVRFMRQAEDEHDEKPLFVIHSTITVPMVFNGNFDIPTVYEFIKAFSAFKSKKENDAEDKKQRIMEAILNMSPKEVEDMLAKLNININSKQTKEAERLEVLSASEPTARIHNFEYMSAKFMAEIREAKDTAKLKIIPLIREKMEKKNAKNSV